MHKALPPLNALRAFEASARHLSLTRAAAELNVTPAALSHQIKGLEEFLDVRLFHRRTRSIELTEAGQLLYPGLNAAFLQIRQSVASLDRARNDNVLVISAPPGFTAKWLAPRLYRFMAANPDIEARISSTMVLADFVRDGVDVAIRNMQVGKTISGLVAERLADLDMLPVCSPRLLEEGGLSRPEDLKNAKLIHDDSLVGRAKLPTWADWLKAAGVSSINFNRGLHFNSADHALDATVEGAGVLLAHKPLAFDDLRTGRLVAPFDLILPSGRAFHFVCPVGSVTRPPVAAFRAWLKEEVDLLDLSLPASTWRPVRSARKGAKRAR